MFSINPKTGTLMFSFLNIETPFFASINATFWGVLTTTAPEIGKDCIILKCMSPVPGGRSIKRKSSSPQSASKII